MEKPACKCARCEERDIEDQKADELGLAFLIALMPLMTLTIFSHMGII